MDPSRFDDLVRALNRPASRRRTLGVLLGSTLAGLGLGADGAKRKHRQHRDAKRRRVQASARKCSPTKTSNSACAQFCAETFGANTPEAGQCTSDAAKCQGLCYGCGPASNGTQKLCGTVCTTLGTNSDCNACNDACTGGKTCYQRSCCTPKTCVQGTDCGSISDGCGGTLNCGTCPQVGQPCTNNVCGACVASCADKTCGASDGCGGTCGGVNQACTGDSECCSGSCKSVLGSPASCCLPVGDTIPGGCTVHTLRSCCTAACTSNTCIS
jgi:hypothetical protein